MTGAPTWTDAGARTTLRAVFDSAVASANPHVVLARFLPEKPRGRCIVVGAGKASAAMAAALEAAWPDVALSGVVVTRYGHAVPTARIRILEAAHPVPDANSEAAAQAVLRCVAGLGPDDLVIALMSGGGSATLALPAPALTLDDKRAVNQGLLRSGAGIGEMNLVRAALSGIKGGRLARAAAPARIVTLAISDVPGDDPATIASGPTCAGVPDSRTVAEILRRHRIAVPDRVAAFLERGHEGALPPPSDVRLIAAPFMALEAAAATARAAGLTPLILGDALEGESRDCGTLMAGIARSVALYGQPVQGPALLLSGGETTVTIRDETPGRGGRNTEFLLGLAVALGAQPNVWAMAGDSDGIDGTEDAAGAIVTPDTLARALALGLDPKRLLAAHDSYTLFKALGDLVVTGPTLTNVNDIRAVLVA